MAAQFFHNFSGRNLPDYSRKDFDSMLVADGIIVKTGYQLTPPVGDIEHLDLDGATVLAAFTDAHVHFTQTGISQLGIQLNNARSVKDILEMVQVEAKNNEYVLGWGLQELALSDRRLPTAAELDKVAANKFVWLARQDLHSAVLNNKAIAWARTINANLPIENGLLKGEEYNHIAYELCDYLSDSFKQKGFKKAEQLCFAKGVAAIHALEGCKKSSKDTIATAEFLAKSPLHGVIYHQSPDPAVPLKKGWRHMGGCLLVDGSIGTRSAAMNAEYEDDPSTSGSLYLKAEDIEQLLKTATQNNLQLALHAIGDRALDTVTSCYAWAQQQFGKPSLPHRIEHFILPSERALKHARGTALMVCIQPAFDHLWGGLSGLYRQRLGKKRAENCNPFKTMLALGIQLAGGSDSPVTPIDPLLGVHSLVNHTNPEERIDLNSALSLFISEPHKLAGEEITRGHLYSGFVADFVCLAEDPFEVSANKLSSLRIEALYIAGKRVK